MFDVREEAWLKGIFTEYHHMIDNALPGDGELQGVTISEKLEKRMARLFYHQKHFYYTWINTAAKRAACIFAALLIAVVATTVSVEGLRDAFINFIIETFEKGSTVFFYGNEGDVSSEIQPIIPKLPTYIPAGYELVTDMSDEIEVNLIYEATENKSLQYVQVPKGSKQTINTENVAYRKIFILDTYEGIIFQNLGNTFLVFNDGEYMYTFMGTLPEEEILKVGESVLFR